MRIALVGPVVVMGTALSLSPDSRKTVARGGLAAQKPLEHHAKVEEKSGKKKRHPVLLHALRWKKRLVAARARRKGGKKVKPAMSEPVHVQREETGTDSRHRVLKAGNRHAPIPVPVPTVPELTADQNQRRVRPDLFISPRRVVVQVGVRERKVGLYRKKTKEMS